MFLNDLNSEAINSNTASPLYHDTKGRFSRSGKRAVLNTRRRNFLDNALLALFIAFLLATDFILFSGSGNIEVFRNSVFPVPEVSVILFLLLVFSSLLVYFLRNLPTVKNALASLVSFGLVFVLYKQFSTIQQILSIGGTNIPVYFTIGIGFALISYGILNYGNFFVRLFLLVAVGTLFFHVYTAYIGQTGQPEFLESYRSDRTGEGEDERFIYFFLPNLASQAYMATDSSQSSFKTRQIMNGFYQKNNFTVYPKAFTPEISFFENMVRSLNPESTDSSKAHILKIRLLSEYWRFHNIRHEYINLKDNSLYDYFQERGYLISAYKSRDFDMCHKNHVANVDRCVEKINQPINIYDIKLSKLSKIHILLMEWLSSMQIFNNTAPVFSVVSDFIDLQQAPMVGIDYSNLYVVNSVQTFDILLKNIMEDKGRQAYFVFIDLPSNMFIYDEFCQLKPTDKWYDISNLPWIKNDLTSKRSKAYMQQTRCLYGKLENFMQKLAQNDMLKDTTIVVQGISGVNNFQSARKDDFSGDFIANRLVSMAVYNGKAPEYKLDWRFCDTGSLLNSYLTGQNSCSQNLNLNVHDTVIKNLNRKIGTLAAGIKKDSQKEFDKWYQLWKSKNQEQDDTAKNISIKTTVENITETEAPAEAKENSEEIQKKDFGL